MSANYNFVQDLFSRLRVVGREVFVVSHGKYPGHNGAILDGPMQVTGIVEGQGHMIKDGSVQMEDGLRLYLSYPPGTPIEPGKKFYMVSIPHEPSLGSYKWGKDSSLAIVPAEQVHFSYDDVTRVWKQSLARLKGVQGPG